MTSQRSREPEATAGEAPRPRRLLVASTGLLIAFVLLNVAVAALDPWFERQRRANLMQAEHVRSADVVPRYDWSVGETPGAYWRAMPDARHTRLVVVSGMSQLYAINEGRPSDLNTMELLDDRAQPLGARVFGVAAPNLNNEEFLIQVAALASRPETTPWLLIYGVCFDKMRNTGVRQGLSSLLRERPEISQTLRQIRDSVGVDLPMMSARVSETLVAAFAADTQNRADGVERRLVKAVERVVPVVRRRSEIRSYLLEQLYLFRNWILRIKTSTKRPMIAGRQELNRQALTAALRLARLKKIKVLVYVIPLNPLAETPYIESEYVAFKDWLANTAAAESASFANLESVVPREDWGLLYGQPDFKHFKKEGHVATAEALFPLLSRLSPTGGAR